MNRLRRRELGYAIKEMKEIIQSITDNSYGDVVDLMDLIEDSQSNVDYILWEEQESYENMPENFQYSDRGTILESNIDVLSNASDTLSDLTDEVDIKIIHTQLEEVISILDDVQ